MELGCITPAVPQRYDIINRIKPYQTTYLVSRALLLECLFDPISFDFGHWPKALQPLQRAQAAKAFVEVVTSVAHCGQLGNFLMECQHRQCQSNIASSRSLGRPKDFASVSSETMLGSLKRWQDAPFRRKFLVYTVQVSTCLFVIRYGAGRGPES